MSDQPAASAKSGAKGGVLKWSLWGVGLAGVAAVVYIIIGALFQNIPGAADAKRSQAGAGAGGLKALAKGEMAKLDVSSAAMPMPDYAFHDAGGGDVRLADFKGEVVVVNLWATWCAPCVTEMPTLAGLAQAYNGRPVQVVAVSLDGASDLAKAKAFIGGHAPLAFYNDPKARIPWALKPPAAGVPTTVIYGKDGLEKARLSGEADWSGAGARAVVDALLAEG
jgi:thiol-disulfide isomerase/thioredoxin